jgi:hypothetical protein
VLSKFLSLCKVSTGISRTACASGDEHLFWNSRLKGCEFDIHPGLA